MLLIKAAHEKLNENIQRYPFRFENFLLKHKLCNLNLSLQCNCCNDGIINQGEAHRNEVHL